MALFKIGKEAVVKLDGTTFEAGKVLERQNLQRFLRDHIEIVAPDTLVIAEEFGDWEDARRRIDLLALDRQANLIVIELKRNETGSHMELQALRYAAMISTLTFDQAVRLYKQYLGALERKEDAEQEILHFLGWNEPRREEFGMDVRIVLASAEFSKELTTSVMWLNQRGLDIRCVRLKPYKDGADIFVDAHQIIPLPEAQEYQVRVREQSEQRREARQKDLSQYQFEGNVYGKGRLVHAIVAEYLRRHPKTDFESLKRTFPHSLQGSIGVVARAEEAKERSDRGGRPRHFIEDDELLTAGDKVRLAVCSQWGSGNIDALLAKAKELGFKIERVTSPSS